MARLMEDHFEPLVDYEFTAELEDFLDSISRDEVGREEYLKKFYFGDGSEDRHNVGLKARLAEKLDAIAPKVSARFLLGIPDGGEHREEGQFEHWPNHRNPSPPPVTIPTAAIAIIVGSVIIILIIIGIVLNTRHFPV